MSLCHRALVGPAIMLASTAVLGSELGRSGFSGNPDTNQGAVCSVCHVPASNGSAASVRLTGPAEVVAGTRAQFALVIEDPAAVSAGVGISISDGIGRLQSEDARLQLNGEELTHVAPVALADGLVLFPFYWDAPAYDARATIYAAVNASDGNRDLIGDRIGSGQLQVTVTGGTLPPPPPPPSNTPPVTLEELVTGLSAPVGIAHAGDERLFVLEQPGTIRVIDGEGQLRERPLLDISANLQNANTGEMGLLGLAFDPDHLATGAFYIYYTYRYSSDGRLVTRVSRFAITSNDPNLADPSSEQIVMEVAQPYPNHNGGALAFGPDGFLYVALGDGGGAGDPLDSAQDSSVLLGKIARIDVRGLGDSRESGSPDCGAASGSGAYRVPPRNAFNDGPGGRGCDEIFLVGTRNPWRTSFDRETGEFWIADVGQNHIEEVNRLDADSAAGANLGWRCYEGNDAYDLSGCGADYLPPLYTYAHENGRCSVTGGVVYRGSLLADLRGKYLFADFCSSEVFALSPSLDGPTVDVVNNGSQLIGPSAFGEDASGELYLADVVTGSIFRLAQGPANPRDSLPYGDCAMNWAEKAYAPLFAPAATATQYDAPYHYRDYSGTGATIRISEIDHHVDYVDAGGTPLDLGPLETWLTLANCEPLPTECLFDWAETSFHDLFPPDTGIPSVAYDLSYRYYPQTASYLGLSSSDKHVRAWVSGRWVDAGEYDYWMTESGCQVTTALAATTPQNEQ